MLAPLAMLAVGCGQPHDPARDHTLVIALAGEPDALLPPLIASTGGFVVADQIHERLAEPDSTLHIGDDRAWRPRLADRWSWSPDSLSIAFHLDPRARWHDGARVVARDVRFTFEVYTDTLVAAAAAPLLDNIDSVTAPNAATAVFWFRARDPEQFYQAAYQMRVLPAHALDTVPRASLRTHPLARAPLGTGPFRFVRWTPGRVLELAANPRWPFGRPRIARLVFRITPDAGAALVAIRAGAVDVLPALRADLVPRDRGALRVLHWPSLSQVLLLFRLSDPADPERAHPVLGDVTVRRALAMAIDRARLAESLGDAVPSRGPLPAALLDDGPPRMPAYDPARARALLEGAGWRVPRGGAVRRHAGHAFAVRMLVMDDGGARTAVRLQALLAAVGARARIDRVDQPTFIARLGAGRFDAAVLVLDWEPSRMAARQLWSGEARRGGSNFAGLRDATLDTLLERAAAGGDGRAAWARLVGDAPAAWLYDLVRTVVLRPCVHPAAVRADAWWTGLHAWRVDAGRCSP